MSPCPFPTTITITPRAPPAICFNHSSLPGGYLQYILCSYRADVNKFLSVVQHLLVREKGVHRRTPLRILLVILQQCHACLVRLIWMVLEMGNSWPCRCCFVGYCFQDLFSIACVFTRNSFLAFFSIRFVNVNMVHPYRIMDTTAAYLHTLPTSRVRHKVSL